MAKTKAGTCERCKNPVDPAATGDAAPRALPSYAGKATRVAHEVCWELGDAFQGVSYAQSVVPEKLPEAVRQFLDAATRKEAVVPLTVHEAKNRDEANRYLARLEMLSKPETWQCEQCGGQGEWLDLIWLGRFPSDADGSLQGGCWYHVGDCYKAARPGIESAMGGEVVLEKSGRDGQLEVTVGPELGRVLRRREIDADVTNYLGQIKLLEAEKQELEQSEPAQISG